MVPFVLLKEMSDSPESPLVERYDHGSGLTSAKVYLMMQSSELSENIQALPLLYSSITSRNS
jgi:hypothetical protein